MAVKIIEGFENGVVGPGVTLGTANGTLTFPAGRTAGGLCAQLALSGGTLTPTLQITRPDTATSILQFGFAAKWSSLVYVPLGTYIAQVREGATMHVGVRQNATTGYLEIVNGAGVVLATSAVTPNLQAWNHFALAVTCHDTAGVATFWLNGVQIMTVSNVDTRNAGTGVLNNGFVAAAGSTLGGVNVQYDDVYLDDSMSFQGDCRVVRLLPTAAGDSTQWTPSTGANWDAVNDTSSTDYVGTAVAGSKDLYGVADLDAALTVIRAVQTDILAWKSDAGAALDLREARKSQGGVETDATVASAAVITTTPTWFRGAPTSVDPAGDAWTAARVNGMQVGVSVP